MRISRDRYARLSLTTVASRPDGSSIFRDSLRLEPAVQPHSMLGLIGDAHAVGSFFPLGPQIPERLEAPLAALLDRLQPGRAATSRLPGDAGLFVRTLAASSEELRRVQSAIHSLARERLFGRGTGHAYNP